MKKYEYKIHRFGAAEIAESKEHMTDMGQQGWELVNATPLVEPASSGGQQFRLYLFWKREIA